MKKAVFFDIDGTLWDRDMVMPESTALAIRKLKENGVYAFLCSGRSRAAIRAKELLDLGFDGIIAAGGTYLEYQGNVLFEERLSWERLKALVKLFRENRIPVIFEGRQQLFADMELFLEDAYAMHLKKLLGDDFKSVGEMNEASMVNKLCAVYTPETKELLTRELGESYKLIFHIAPILELLPGGFSKAAGIERMCGLLEIPHDGTYAFGDSLNDIEMLRYVKYGVAMGNGYEEVKAAADYVTSPLKEDGIWRGLEHFGLIGSCEK